MGELLIVLLILVLIALAVGAVVLGRRNRKQREQRAAAKTAKPQDPFGSGDVDSLRGDPRALRAGAIVEVRGVNYAVRGSLRLTEDGWSWAEHFLDDAKGRRVWLSVEEDPELELVLFTAAADAEVTPGKSVEFEGRTYRRTESGTARFTAEGTTGLDSSGTLHYQDYVADDDARLSLEAYGTGDKWEVSSGEVLSRYEVRIFPAGGEADD